MWPSKLQVNQLSKFQIYSQFTGSVYCKLFFHLLAIYLQFTGSSKPPLAPSVKSFKKDFNHFITEHYNPMQKMVDELASKSCRCYTIGPGGRMEPGWMSLRGHSFYLRRVVTPSSGSWSSSAPDLNSVSSSSEDEGSFKTSRSEVQGVSTGPGDSDAVGGTGSQAGVGGWDGHGKVVVKRNTPHLPDWCKDCAIDPMGEWEYCKKSHYHPEHPRHTCAVNAPCYCHD